MNRYLFAIMWISTNGQSCCHHTFPSVIAIGEIHTIICGILGLLFLFVTVLNLQVVTLTALVGRGEMNGGARVGWNRYSFHRTMT
jgi:hypothetical protein